jgi:hypothetical protein
VPLTATVTGVSAPEGTVTFRDGAVTLGTAKLGAHGLATFTTSTLAIGAHALRASYGGTATLAPSASPVVNMTVDPDAVVVTLSASANPSRVNEAVTFTARLTSGSGSSAPTGSVIFRDGGTILGSAALASASATFTAGGLAPGNHSITATYAGDATHAAGSSAALPHFVLAEATAIVLTSSPAAPSFGDLVTLTATVEAGATGAVTFRSGAVVLGTASLDAAGAAVLATDALPAGERTLTVSYAGDDSHVACSDELVLTVGRAETSTALLASRAHIAEGDAVTFTVVVDSAVAAVKASGSVVVKRGGTEVARGNLDGGRATFTTRDLPAGTFALTAEYAGDDSFAPSVSATLTQTVDEGASEAGGCSAAPGAPTSLLATLLLVAALLLWRAPRFLPVRRRERR